MVENDLCHTNLRHITPYLFYKILKTIYKITNLLQMAFLVFKLLKIRRCQPGYFFKLSR